MHKTKYFIGIDISADDFSASCISSPDNIVFSTQKFSNNIDGAEEFLSLLSKHNIKQSETIICMEATGVYSENITYFLASKGFTISIEAPQKVKNKTKDTPRKNDFIDALSIAEYAYRYYDKLPIWKPKNEILEQIQVLLTTREHLSVQMTANINALKTLKHKYYQTPLANQIYEKTISKLKEHIKEIDREIKALINKDDSFKNNIFLAMSVPGVGLLLAANLLVLAKGFTEVLNYKRIASYTGICPYEQMSGTSLHKPPRSRKCGPSKLRKLLYLAALSVRTHKRNFKKYFLRKVSEGKNKRLILNNIENKLLKIICAVINSGVAYTENYKSINPNLLKSD
ncbi:IS110 family transposase [Rosettibacter firmus]|uniref:IS110 family transposase n=1 Tax=Rosettibacter firmus TaxID=3111522 RepID=UPI00336BBC62